SAVHPLIVFSTTVVVGGVASAGVSGPHWVLPTAIAVWKRDPAGQPWRSGFALVQAEATLLADVGDGRRPSAQSLTPPPPGWVTSRRHQPDRDLAALRRPYPRHRQQARRCVPRWVQATR